MGSQRIRTLTDLLRNGYWALARCDGCQHEARIDPMLLIDRQRNVGGSVQLDRVAERMKCSRCGGKAVEIAFTYGPEVWS